MATRPHNFQRHFFTAALLGDMPVEIALTLDIALLFQPERQVACVKIIVPISARIGLLIRRQDSQRFNGLEHAKQRLDGIVTIGPLRKEDQCSGKNGSHAIPKVNHKDSFVETACLSWQRKRRLHGECNSFALEHGSIICYTLCMKLTLRLHLLPTVDQHAALRETMRLCNEAATYAAAKGFAAGVYGQVSLHHLAYYEIRERFGLSAQLAVRAIAKAVECFQRDKTVCPVFRADGAVCYDQRVLSFHGLNSASIWAIGGRVEVPFLCGPYQQARQGRKQGKADLVLRDGVFYLLCTIDMPEDTQIEPQDVMGVDLGVVNLATDRKS